MVVVEVLKLILLLLSMTAAAAASQMAKPGCREKCGNVSIPYPFGTTKGCSLDERYLLSCNETGLFLSPEHSHNVLEVLHISVGGELRVLMKVVEKCYDRFGNVTKNITSGHLKAFHFPFSVTRNIFVGIGCDTRATLHCSDTLTSCDSYCNKHDKVTNGYCQINMPNNSLTSFSLFKFVKHSNTLWRSNPCDHAFIIEKTSFHFSEADLQNFTTRVPSVLDWAVATNETCKDAMRNSLAYACKSKNSHCYDSGNAPGYRCNCSTGYQGNPYLTNGCQDIDECADQKLNNCVNKCINTKGNFKCACPKGETGDGTKDGKGCEVDQSTDDQSTMIKFTVGFGVGLIVLVICGSWLYMGLKKRRLVQLKHKFFMQNGGLMLQQRLSKFQGYNETARIFTAQELEKATDKYHNSKIVGQGGYGTVYKGILADDRVVAIKKSKLMDQIQIEPFINELVVLSQINHRNVVRLLGCCLETEVPLLVYEFVSNGTLSNHIHEQTKASAMSWDTRIKIATETAGVLSYLHSAASVPIVHRDIKSTNILLDENYTAKVSDFGNSRLIPIDQTELTTLVQGTLGYLDPEYFVTSQLTEKSDVYSFGVLLAELITGKKALCFERPEAERSLANYFLVALRQGRLFEVVGDYNMPKEENIDEINEVATLAERCVRVKGEERPSMKEVATALERLMRNRIHARVDADTVIELTHYFPGDGQDTLHKISIDGETALLA